MKNIIDYLDSPPKPIVIFDGAMGTSLQLLNLKSDDFGDIRYEGCNENLVRTLPKAVEGVHASFLEAGSDVIETNTFGATSIVLAEYGLEHLTYELNLEAARIAKNIANKYSTQNKPRYVAGSIGPTTKLPTLGHIDFDVLSNTYEEQIDALVEGGVDLLLLETCQDILQIKAALIAANKVFDRTGVKLPVMVSVTMETTGTMLIGTDISAVVTTLEPFDIDILGLNCATGPEQMKPHIRYLSEYSPFKISCIPNAGLPENVGGQAVYKLTPIELKMQLMHFIKDLGVQIVGGCCGTTPSHIKALNTLVQEIKSSELNLNRSKKNYVPSASSIYETTNYFQDNSFLIVGERLNASGSRKVKNLLSENDWEGLLSIAKEQQKENAHILDVNVDYVGRDGVKDMSEIVSRLVTNINLPLMLDSTDYLKMESGLKKAGGKCILNSTNFEDGEQRFFNILKLAKSYGSAIVIGTIDEEGMARTSQRKVSISKRSYQATVNYGISECDIFFDPLVLPITTGIEEDRVNALETIKSIQEIRNSYPNVHIILGISNVSFGLNPAARITLNSVFLDECIKSGLDSAIISPSKILPLSKIKEQHYNLCLDLIYDRRKFNADLCIYDPLTKLTEEFVDKSLINYKSDSSAIQSLPIEKRLKQHIIEGDRTLIKENLEEALKTYKALEIINEFLLDGMKVVGELFGSGQMQLPFVLQSAETMKYAVSILEPYMEVTEEKISKGIFLIATVKGDVHDIGKNLVDIILSNNGYDVINLGIKQDITSIIDAQKIHKADCIAMSGLLVKSTAFMKDNLETLNEHNISVPVVLGGAALTPKFVNKDCSLVYKGKVIYGKDAFTDLRFMEAYMKAKKEGQWDNYNGFLQPNPEFEFKVSETEKTKSIAAKDSPIIPAIDQTLLVNINSRSKAVPAEPPVSPPFIGSKIVNSSDIDFNSLVYYLDKGALFTSQWQFKKKKGEDKTSYLEFVEKKVEPILQQWLDKIQSEKLINPSFVYGYYPCARFNNKLNVYTQDRKTKLGQFTFPRQKSGNHYCISDFYNDLNDGQPIDFLPMQAVTMGKVSSKFALSLYEENKYTDYLYFHGLTVQLTEALAEYTHALIRKECGFNNLEPEDINGVLAQRYRGCRYSFGYPACPNVSDSKLQLEWLEADRIGMSMDESDQLHPEQSTTAIVALHSNAKYFSA